MAIIHGITANQIVPQPDFDATESENGGIEASQSFLILKTSIDITSVRQKFAIGTQLSTLDPNCSAIFAFLQIIKVRSAKVVEGGYMMVSCDFAGYTSTTFNFETGEPDPQPTFSKRGIVVEAPLSEHPKFKQLDDTQKFLVGLVLSGDATTKKSGAGVLLGTYKDDGTFMPFMDEDDVDIFILQDTDAFEFLKLIRQGITTYMKSSVSYTHTFESNKPIANSFNDDLGKKADPAGDPGSYDDRNWVLVGLNQVQTGSGDFMFKNEIEYMLSEKGGYNEFLYE